MTVVRRNKPFLFQSDLARIRTDETLRSRYGWGRTLLRFGVAMASFAVLSYGARSLSRAWRALATSGALSRKFVEGVKVVKKLGLEQGNLLDVILSVSRRARRVAYKYVKWSQDYRDASRLLHFGKALRKIWSGGKASLKGFRKAREAYRRVGLRGALFGAFLRGAERGVGFAILSSAADALTHSFITPADREKTRKYGPVARVKRFFTDAVLFSGLQGLWGVSKVAFPTYIHRYSPQIQRFLTRIGAPTYVAKFYGWRRRFYDYLIRAIEYKQKFTQKLQGANIWQHIKQQMKEHPGLGAIATYLREQIREAHLHAKKSFRRPGGFPPRSGYDTVITMMNYAKEVNVKDPKFAAEIAAQAVGRYKGVSKWRRLLNIERERLTKKQAVAFREMLEKMGFSKSWIETLKGEERKFYENLYYRVMRGPLFHGPGWFEVAGQKFSQYETRYFVKGILQNLYAGRWRGVTRILASAAGLDLYANRRPVFIFHPTMDIPMSVPIPTDEGVRMLRLVTERGNDRVRHGIVFLQNKLYRLSPTEEGGEYFVDRVIENVKLYESPAYNILKRELTQYYIKQRRRTDEIGLRPPGEYVRDIIRKLSRGVDKASLEELVNVYKSTRSTAHIIFGKLLSKKEVREVASQILEQLGASRAQRILQMDEASLIRELEKVIEKPAQVTERLRNKFIYLINASRSRMRTMKDLLNQEFIGSGYAEARARHVIESFLIEQHLTPEIRAKFFSRLAEEQLIGKWIRKPAYTHFFKALAELAPVEMDAEALRSTIKGALNDIVVGWKKLPTVDPFRPISALFQYGGLGIHRLFEPTIEGIRVMGTTVPFTVVREGMSPFKRYTVTSLLFSHHLRRIWGFMDYVSKAPRKFPIIRHLLRRLDPRLADTAHIFPFETNTTGWTASDMIKNLWKPAATLLALGVGYKAVDTFFDESGLFEGTALGEGLTPAILDAYALGRLSLARVLDIAGVTDAARYLEGLMPGSTTWLPGALYGVWKFAPAGPAASAMGALIMGAVNKMLAPFLPDLTKSYDQLKRIYRGEEYVPVRRARYWPLSLTPWEGYDIEYWRPSLWFIVRQQAKYTPDISGSKIQSLLQGDWLFGYNPLRMFDPYAKERQHYFSRPAPLTQLPFWDVPVIGPFLALTVGQVLKPQQMMHTAFLKEMYPGEYGVPKGEVVTPEDLSNPDQYVSAMQSNQAVAMLMNRYAGRAYRHVTGDMLNRGITETLYRSMEMAGLRGYLTSLLLGTQTPLNFSRYLEMYGENEGFLSEYWNMELNDVAGGLSEMIRRFRPDKRINTVNPIPNLMAQFLPEGEYGGSDFLHGDPYTKIPMGFIRLPGTGYEATHNVMHTFPASLRMLGKTVTEIRDIMAGWEDIIEERTERELNQFYDAKKIVQGLLEISGQNVEMDVQIYDPYNNIVGTVDAVVRRGRFRQPIIIRPVSEEEFRELVAPKEEHASQVNFAMKFFGAKTGKLIYVNVRSPEQIKTYTIFFDPSRLREDISALKRAREQAGELLRAGAVFDYGRSYSWFDRYRILADVAPLSDQYKQARAIVLKQLQQGFLPPELWDEVHEIERRRRLQLLKYPMYVRRFTGENVVETVQKLLHPPRLSGRELSLSLNPYLRSPDEYSLPERIVGSIWETFTHLPTPYNRKFFFQYSPSEIYKYFHLYDREYKAWTRPIEDWVKPQVRTMLASQGVMEGAASWATAGYAVGRLYGGLIGAVAGSIYGLIPKPPMIPEDVEKAREAYSYYDKLKYARNMQFYVMTGNRIYEERAERTLLGAKNLRDYVRALPRFERPFTVAFMNITDESERERIRQIISPEARRALDAAWARRELRYSVEEGGYEEVPRTPANWAGWIFAIPDEDIYVKELEQRGVDPLDFGYGYHGQAAAVRRLSEDFAIPDQTVDVVNIMDVQETIVRSLQAQGINASVSIMGFDNSRRVDVVIYK